MPNFVVCDPIRFHNLPALPQRLLVAVKQTKSCNPKTSTQTSHSKESAEAFGFKAQLKAQLSLTADRPDPNDKLCGLRVILGSKVGCIRDVDDEKKVADKC